MSKGSREHPLEGAEKLTPDMIMFELEMFGPLKVLIVDDFALRNRCYIDFCEGGNSMAYPWLEPKTVILAKSIPDEWDLVKLHEVREYNKMDRDGWSYEKAHKYANVGEMQARHDRGLLKDLLDAELEILNRGQDRMGDLAKKARKFG